MVEQVETLEGSLNTVGPDAESLFGVPALNGEVPSKAGLIEGLRLVQVSDLMHLRVWESLMDRDHPNGKGRAVGRMVRYLVESAHGVLGGFGFGEAAWWLKDRDGWIGWDQAARCEHLGRVVGMSRFLIRREVRCKNLASRLISLALDRIADDFEQAHGVRPVLVETFVDTTRFEGTVYRAANWQEIGRTAGRGRNDRGMEYGKSVKAIYVRVLDPGFRAKMGVAEPLCLEPGQGLDSDQWAQQEFGGAPLGDKRLSKRLVQIGALKGDNPGQSFCQIAGADRGLRKSLYRFVSSGHNSEMNVENILAPHRQSTLARMRQHKVVLAVQDTSDLNYHGLLACEGLGMVGKNSRSGESSKGLRLHGTLALCGEGIPLGVLRADIHARQIHPGRTNSDRRKLPSEQKESHRWIEGFRDCVVAAAQTPGTRVICVADREADLFELFKEQEQSRSVELLVRATHQRADLRLGQESLFTQMRARDLKATFTVEVPYKSPRSSKTKHSAAKGCQARQARMQLRYGRVSLPVPAGLRALHKEPIEVWMIHAVEIGAPEGIEPIEWFLLTTIEVQDNTTALQCLKWYRLRWRIEEWHRVLKSGCKIEDAKNRSAENLKRVIAIDLVVAWRIMALCLLGREVPAAPINLLFSPLEIKVLEIYTSKKNSNNPKPSKRPMI